MHYVWALERDYQILTFDYPLEYSNNQELCIGIAGLCLFSTACLNSDTLEELSVKAKHVNLLLGIMKTVPYGLLKPIFRRACMKHLVNATKEEYQYMKDLIEMMKNPMVVEHMEGGHLATVLRTKDYVKVIRKFTW